MTAAWAKDVLDFWFVELQRRDWFVKDDRIDAAIRERFAQTYDSVVRMKADELMRDGETALAAILVLDQFPRNMFRGTAQAFASDAQARGVAMRAVALHIDQQVESGRRIFIYLPFEHSEDAADQQRSIELISALGDGEFTKYAEAHAAVIRRFGRFPHRNRILGRKSSAEEEAYLAQPGSGF